MSTDDLSGVLGAIKRLGEVAGEKKVTTPVTEAEAKYTLTGHKWWDKEEEVYFLTLEDAIAWAKEQPSSSTMSIYNKKRGGIEAFVHFERVYLPVDEPK